MANPVGRPKKTLADLPENWQEIMEEWGRKGGGKVECYVELGISDDLYERFLEDYPEFSHAEKRRKALSEVWWSQVGRDMAAGESNGSAASWIFNMKNRFGWRDKQEIDIGGDINLHFDPEDSNA